MHRLILLLALILGTGLMWADGSAQIPPGSFPENHYMVYHFLGGEGSVTGPIILEDQFGVSQHTFAVLEKFATPVDKNGEGIYDPLFHQTWWTIDDPRSPRTVVVDNQFGEQTWVIGDGRYLVLPATKNQSPPEEPPPDLMNHYKCYDAQGPLVDQQVSLIDQFIGTDEFPLLPLYLCNPVKKDWNGRVSEIVDPDTHLACYLLHPEEVFFALQAGDQFGVWNLVDLSTELFCVPSKKNTPTPTDESSWGEVKSIYR